MRPSLETLPRRNCSVGRERMSRTVPDCQSATDSTPLALMKIISAVVGSQYGSPVAWDSLLKEREASE